MSASTALPAPPPGGGTLSAEPPPGAGSSAVPRLAAVWVPDWPVVALTLEQWEVGRKGREGGCRPGPGARPGADPALEPVAVVGAQGVLAASAPARAAGVRTGMRLRTARSLCPDLTVLPPEPEREARAFEPVVAAVESLVADVVVARPGLALLGARGPARWVGGEEELACAVVEAVAAGPGVECQVGVADSLLGAVLAARHGVVVTGPAADFLAPWPLSAVLTALTTSRVRAEARELLEVLQRLGLHTLGDLAALPARSVAARFGPLGERLHVLARGQGHHLPRTDRPVADLTVSTTLDPPVERADAAAFAARTLAEDLADTLVVRGLGAGLLVVEARAEDGSDLTRSWALEGSPTVGELTDRVRWQLEGWLSGRAGRPPSAPLTRLRLTAGDLDPVGGSQVALWGRSGMAARRRSERAAERVESLLGAGSVQLPLLVPGRDPRSRSVLVGRGEEVSAVGTAGRQDTPPAAWVGALPPPSPALVMARPVPARLVDARGRGLAVDAQGMLDGVPAHGLGGAGEVRAGRGESASSEQRWRVPEWVGEHEVVSWAGPWPVDEGWWRGDGGNRRAYLQVVPGQGPPLLLVRRGRWWLDAVYT